MTLKLASNERLPCEKQTIVAYLIGHCLHGHVRGFRSWPRLCENYFEFFAGGVALHYRSY